MTATKHHVFLVRHCVRSTKDEVNLWQDGNRRNNNDNDDDDDDDEHVKMKIPLQNFTASPMPRWNTPSMWCTQQGLRWTQKIGAEILRTKILDPSHNIRIQFVTDESERDVQTAFALMQGMKYAAGSVRIEGMQNLLYDKVVFKPIEGDQPFCKLEYTPDRLKANVEHRLQKVPPPPKGLGYVLRLLDERGGIGAAGSLVDMGTDLVLSASSNYTKLAGPVNVVKLFAQCAFYSRAGGIDPPFLPDLTTDEVYELVEWIQWTRSILEVDNVRATSVGSVVANAVLSTLRRGFYSRRDPQDIDDHYDTKVTIFVGHDGDLDRLASALRLRWKLNRPYRSGNEDDVVGKYVSTPPNVALHFSHVSSDDVPPSVEMSLIYPVFFGMGDRGNETFKQPRVLLQQVPVQFDPPFSNASVKYTTNSTILTPDERDGPPGLLFDMLDRRLKESLQKYPEGMECYAKSFDQMGVRSSTPSSPDETMNIFAFVFGVAVVVLAVAALLASGKKWCFRSHRTQYVSTEMADTASKATDVDTQVV